MKRRRSDIIDITGHVYGRLTVLADTGTQRNHRALWRCRCECGRIVVVRGDKLRSGWTRSCGCMHNERWSQLSHGQARTPEYRCWAQAKSRCVCSTYKEYRYYGGRGISMSQAWRDSFEQFLADMGPRPTPKHSLDRIDTNGNYEAGNCRWATSSEQATNKRNNRHVTHNGKTMTIGEWARVAGIPSGVLHQRLVNMKWTISRALTQPVRPSAADRATVAGIAAQH